MGSIYRLLLLIQYLNPLLKKVPIMILYFDQDFQERWMLR